MVQNNSKPLKIKATKPITVKKKLPLENKAKEHVEDVRQRSNPLPAPQPRGNRGLLIFLAILSALLLAALLYLLIPGKQSSGTTLAGDPSTANPEEKRFQDSLGPLSSNVFSVSDQAFANPIVLTDTLKVEKDSIHIMGTRQIVLQRDSTFAGPAIFFSSGCKYVLLENIRFEGFDMALLSSTKSIHFKNVQFVNCRIPLQYQVQFPDNAFITGSLDSFRIKADSLVLQTPTN
jgi:hypothetical protein